ncbi:MAG: hypothetical protein LBI54_03570 [Lachnospiraceae bacterium]|jgi:predicted nucleic acid-binding protein|nr:hypothetical protein [Lachnospiraceae bacterium]
MDKIKVYMDNCCYGRPFDDLTQKRIKDEAAAKMFIQSLVRYKSISLCSSYVLTYEISGIPSESNREHIYSFVMGFSDCFVGYEQEKEAILLTNEIMETGIKRKDASHLACSIIAECDYFITTDDRVLKFNTKRIKVINPIDFVNKWREQND